MKIPHAFHMCIVVIKSNMFHMGSHMITCEPMIFSHVNVHGHIFQMWNFYAHKSYTVHIPKSR